MGFEVFAHLYCVRLCYFQQKGNQTNNKNLEKIHTKQDREKKTEKEIEREGKHMSAGAVALNPLCLSTLANELTKCCEFCIIFIADLATGFRLVIKKRREYKKVL